MTDGAKKQEPGLHWKWVILSVVAGIGIVGLSYFTVAPTFHSASIQALVMLVAVVVTGAINGYFSPGVTIREATVGGAIVAAFMLILIYVSGAEVQYSAIENIFLLLLGIGFSWVGGWVGEKLQGDETSADEKTTNAFQWKWVIAGVIVGFALNVLFVFIPAKIFKINLGLELISYLVSFVATGFVVGYKSPGVTILEPAAAGLVAVLLEWGFLQFMINLPVDGTVLGAGLGIGFLFTLFGAWLGEKVQENAEKKGALS